MQATIYQIKSEKFEFESYVGSTTNFKQRRKSHKLACTNSRIKGYNYPVYKFIRENGGWDDWEMIKLFDVTVKDRKELYKIEGHCVKDYGGTLNRQIPGRTQREYWLQNKEKIQASQRKYNVKNKTHKRNYDKIYSAKHKTRLKGKQRQYRERNKELINIKNRIYRKKNIDKIKARDKEKTTCECGSVLSRANMARHKKSAKHFQFMEQ
jgi:hypothetical protein